MGLSIRLGFALVLAVLRPLALWLAFKVGQGLVPQAHALPPLDEGRMDLI